MPTFAEPLEVTTIARRGAGGVLRVEVAGDVDDASAPVLGDALRQAMAGHPGAVGLQLDLSRVTHFSCAGLEVLVDARQRLDGALTVVGAQRPVRRVLDVLHLWALFGVPSADGR